MPESEETSEMEEWPPHFPDGCPPVTAFDLSEVVLYLVKSDPPVAEDFLSAAERGAFADALPCERAALSCGLTLQYIEQLRKAVPRLRLMRIASAALQAQQGKIGQTGKPGHYSMWLRSSALRTAPTLFRVVK